jgi:hypothetical protein
MEALGWVGFRHRYPGTRRLLVTALSMALSMTALAQVGPPQPPVAANTSSTTQPNDLAEVVVTGSHIAESTFTSPTPVTVIDSGVIQSLGLVNVGDVLNQMPQNSNFTSPANVGLGNFNIGAQFANLRGLDPFYGTRTLTLLNSQRFVPTSAGGAVDLNVVPSILIARTEVVTGGASAAYGSDAEAGVVNVIMDDKFEGFKLQLDGGDMHAALAFGKAFLDGRLHEAFRSEYEDSQTIGFCGEVRPWCTQGNAQYTNTGYLTNGAPHYVIGPNFYDNVTIRPPVTHWSLYSHTSLEVTSSLEASLDVSFAQRRATNIQGSDGPSGFPVNVIYPNNAYLPASAAAAMGPLPAWFAANTSDAVSLINSTTNNVGRISLGLNWALNAVTNPANGQVVCAATLPDHPAYNPLAAGCSPLNLFGAHNASAASLA